ncbi:MAG: adenylate/guanylate cyclase domain-containing protein [Acidimicrobiia bacterium]|nr:adenylate/guanylate cyclase domain-containing protein [Acidimicrobiia bacterium]
MGSVRPSGTVTFLFTDIEGSTRLWEEQPEVMEGTLEGHDEIVREAIESESGYVFATGGDGFAAAFATADDAVSAARRAQLCLLSDSEPFQLSVRMAVHTGEASERDGDYFGGPVNRAARLMSVAHGGQIVVSGATALLLRDAAALRPLGDHRLRDLGERMPVFQVVADGLPVAFPPLLSLDAYEGNLPEQLTSFVGRDQDLVDLIEKVRAGRVVTVIGVGGIGKTRLALQAAAELVSEFADGVWFADLASTRSAGGVAEGVAVALAVRPSQGQSPEDRLLEHLESRTALLILDNCEHLIAGVAGLAEQLVQACPRLRVLSTSREALMVSGEQIKPLAPLSVASEVGSGRSEAAELLVERVRSERGEFDPSPSEQEAIDSICEQLDGMPLAIELAASRCRSLGVSDVATRLGERFRLLSGGRRTSVERHQTLRAAVDWSYRLLDDAERRVFDALAVFVGDFRTDDAVVVIADDATSDFDVVDAVSSLVDKSMCVADLTAEPTTYRYLETMRAYARDHLEQSGTLQQYRDRHAACFGELARRAESDMTGPHERDAERSLDRRWPDFRAALEWAIETATEDVISRIGELANAVSWRGNHTAIGWFYALRHETTRWSIAQDTAVGGAFMTAIDLDEVMRLADDAIETWEASRPPLYSLMHSGWAAWVRGDVDTAIERHRTLYALAKNDSRPRVRFVGEWPLATVLAMAGEPDSALIASVIDNAAAADWPTARAFGLHARAFAERRTDFEASMRTLQEALALARDIDSTQVEALAWRELLGLQAEHLSTSELALELTSLCRHLQSASNSADSYLTVTQVIKLLAREQRHQPTVVLHAWLDGRSGGGRADHLLLDELAAQATHSLTEVARLQADGRTMSTSDALDYACNALSDVETQSA